MGENKKSISIQEFYKGKSVFITGATGFLGKLIVEKLLRSCPDVDKVYILARAKKGKSVQERVDDLIKVPAFNKIRENRPNDLTKIIAIEGDITKENYGMSEDDLKLLYDNVGVVIHSAATISFNEPLRVATRINLMGTKEIMRICGNMNKLESIVYVSTAYTNVDRPEAREVIYPRDYQPEDIINISQTLSDEALEMITPTLLGKMPNTYTFTKALAEAAVSKEAEKLPIAIVRPSLITSSHSEPEPGWLDSTAGPAHFLVCIGKGLMRSAPGIKSLKADLIPVDMTVNMCLAAAWDVAVRKPKSLPIYNCTSGQINALNYKEFLMDVVPKYLVKYPMNGAIRYPSLTIHENEITNKIHSFFSHTVAANLIDFSRRLQGKKPIMVDFYKKLDHQYKTVASVAVNKQYKFYSENPQKLIDSMSKHDREVFPFDVRKINLEKYVEDYILGIRKYLLKEDQSTEALKVARERMQRLKVRQRFTRALIIGIPSLILGSMIFN